MLKLTRLFILLILLPFNVVAVKTQPSAGVVVNANPQEKYYGDEKVLESISITYAKEIAAIEAYLDSYTTLTGLFKQAGKNGKISYGKLLIAKPGRIRCEYLKPSPITIIINEDRVTYYDKELDEVSRTSTETNALKFLAIENIRFADLNLVELEKDNHFLSLSIKEYSKELKQNLIVTLKFLYPEVTLRQLSIFTENNEVDMVFEQVLYDQPMSKKLFYFHKNSK